MVPFVQRTAVVSIPAVVGWRTPLEASKPPPDFNLHINYCCVCCAVNSPTSGQEPDKVVVVGILSNLMRYSTQETGDIYTRRSPLFWALHFQHYISSIYCCCVVEVSETRKSKCCAACFLLPAWFFSRRMLLSVLLWTTAVYSVCCNLVHDFMSFFFCLRNTANLNSKLDAHMHSCGGCRLMDILPYCLLY